MRKQHREEQVPYRGGEKLTTGDEEKKRCQWPFLHGRILAVLPRPTSRSQRCLNPDRTACHWREASTAMFGWAWSPRNVEQNARPTRLALFASTFVYGMLRGKTAPGTESTVAGPGRRRIQAVGAALRAAEAAGVTPATRRSHERCEVARPVTTCRESRLLQRVLRLKLATAAWQIRSQSSGNWIPTAAADCGKRLVLVMPGTVFTSRHHGCPSASSLKLTRL